MGTGGYLGKKARAGLIFLQLLPDLKQGAWRKKSESEAGDPVGVTATLEWPAPCGMPAEKQQHWSMHPCV